MSDQKFPASKVILGAAKGKLVRFAHVHLHTSRLQKQNGRMAWSTLVMIPKENIEDVAAAQHAIFAQQRALWFDERTGKLTLPPKAWNPLLDADVDTHQDGKPWGGDFAGHYLINVKSEDDPTKPDNSPPEVIGIVRGPDGKFVRLGAREIKSGDWGRVSVNFKSYRNGAGGVGAYLNRVQRVEEGAAMSNRGSAEDDFGSFDDQDDEDPMLA